MSNWGFESPEEWLHLLKLNNLLHIHVKNKNDPWYVLAPISQLLLGQKSKVRTVLKSWQRALFKTDLTFWIWWRFDEDIAKNNKKRNFKNHPLVIFFWPMGVSVLKRSVSTRRFQGYQSYNRFMEGKWGFWPSKCKFWVKKSRFLTIMPYETQWNPKKSNLLSEKINLHLK